MITVRAIKTYVLLTVGAPSHVPSLTKQLNVNRRFGNKMFWPFHVDYDTIFHS